MRGFSFQKVPNCDWHGPRSQVDRVGPIKTTDQVPAEIVQIALRTWQSSPRLCLHEKPRRGELQRQPCRSQDRRYSLGACFSVLCVRCDVYNPEFGALFRFPCYCPRMPRDGALALSDVSLRPSRLPASRANRHGRYSVARLVEEHGDAKLTERLQTLDSCPKTRSPSIHDQCKVVYEGLMAG